MVNAAVIVINTARRGLMEDNIINEKRIIKFYTVDMDEILFLLCFFALHVPVELIIQHLYHLDFNLCDIIEI